MTVHPGSRPPAPWWTSIAVGTGSALMLLSGLGLAVMAAIT